ncbi:imm11 family protein [Caloranaerobacter sp. DY30410]
MRYFFRLKEDETPIFVSERFVDIVKKYGMTGIDFGKVKVY